MKSFFIAEVGQAHDGSLGILHSFIDAASQTGVDAIKFQTHIAEAESSIHEPFRVRFSYADKTRIDYWRRMEFASEQWEGIKKHCDDVGLEFMSSPFSIAAVDLLEKIGVKRYKVGSGEVTNYLLLEKIARTGKPIILSSGMSSYSELDRTVNFLKEFGNEISILQCTTAYPTPADKTGLNVIPELKNRYPQYQVGLSDHSGKIYPFIAAAALGAELFEFHVAFDRRMFGPDSSSSILIDEVKQLVEGVRFVETSLNNPVNKEDNSSFLELKKIFGKSLAVNKELKKGHTLAFDDLETKKPAGMGISADKYLEVVGRKLKRNLEKYEFLSEEHLEK